MFVQFLRRYRRPKYTQEIPYRENQNILIADYDVTDPDSWPEDSLRIDNNKSTKEGAKVIYSLEWNADEDDPSAILDGIPSDYFEITNDGRLYFKSAPDYDVLGDTKNTYKLKVLVEDAIDLLSEEHERTSDYRLLNVKILDINRRQSFCRTAME